MPPHRQETEVAIELRVDNVVESSSASTWVVAFTMHATRAQGRAIDELRQICAQAGRKMQESAGECNMVASQKIEKSRAEGYKTSHFPSSPPHHTLHHNLRDSLHTSTIKMGESCPDLPETGVAFPV